MKKEINMLLAGFIILALTGGSCPGSNGSNQENNAQSAAASGSTATDDTDAFVVTTDFTTGSFAVVHLADQSVQSNVGSILADATATFFGDSLYVVNRLGQDNIQTIKASDLVTETQFSTGNGSNPQDIAMVSAAKAYVSRLNEVSLLVMNPGTGDTLGTIDLTSHADADGKPEATGLLLHNDKLYAALGRLDQDAFLFPTDHSEIVIIDTVTNTVEKTLITTVPNPYTDFVYHATMDRILISEVGFFGVNDGGIESINPTTGASEGLIVTEATMGGDIIAFDILSKTKGYAVVAGGTVCDNNAGTCQTNVTQLMSFNPTTGAKLATVFVGGPFTLVDVRFNSLGQAYLCDTTFTKPGIRIFDGTTDLPVNSDPIDTGLPPYKVVFFNR